MKKIIIIHGQDFDGGKVKFMYCRDYMEVPNC